MHDVPPQDLGILATRVGRTKAACRLVEIAAGELQDAGPEHPGERMEVLEGMAYVLSLVIESLAEIQNALTR